MRVPEAWRNFRRQSFVMNGDARRGPRSRPRHRPVTTLRPLGGLIDVVLHYHETAYVAHHFPPDIVPYQTAAATLGTGPVVDHALYIARFHLAPHLHIFSRDQESHNSKRGRE